MVTKERAVPAPRHRQYGFGKPSLSPTGIAGKMEGVLDRLRQKGIGLEGASKTIAKRLNQAVHEFGPPPIDEKTS
jgi:hypothetical protein